MKFCFLHRVNDILMISFLLSILVGFVSLGQAINATVRESLINCFKETSAEYFTDEMALLLVSSPETDWMEEIIAYMIGSMKWSVELSNEENPPTESDYSHLRLTHQRADNIIILMRRETEDARDKLARLWRNRLWNSSARILIVVESDGNGEEMLRSLWRMKRAMNAVVMVVGEDGIRFATWHPFRNGGEIVVANALKDGIVLEKEVYRSHVPTDFKGYKLKLATWFAEPYVMKPKTPGMYEDGLEVKIMKEFEKQFNFTLEYVQVPEGENAYVTVMNGTPHGLFGLVHRGEADFLCLGIRARYDRIVIADPLPMHSEDRSVWVVPLVQLPNVVFYHVFEFSLWLAVVVSFALLTGVLILINYRETLNGSLALSDCIFESIRFQLYQPVIIKFTKTKLKIFAVLFYFYSQQVTIAYNSTLLRMLTTPSISAHAETPKEALESGLIAYLYPSGKARYNQSEHELWNEILQPENHIFTEDAPAMLTVVSVNKTGFTLMLENVAKYMMGKDRRLQKVRILDEPFGLYPVSIFIARGHPLKNVINRKMEYLFESGIVNVWLGSYLSGYRKWRMKEMGFQQHKPIKLERFWTIFAFVLSSWILSTAIFLFELLIGKITANRERKMKETISEGFARDIAGCTSRGDYQCHRRRMERELEVGESRRQENRRLPPGVVDPTAWQPLVLHNTDTDGSWLFQWLSSQDRSCRDERLLYGNKRRCRTHIKRVYYLRNVPERAAWDHQRRLRTGEYHTDDRT